MDTSSNALRVPDAQPDEMIDGRYRVLATLGKGGMAVVYGVHETATGERRALKRLVAPDEPEKRMDAVAFFEREFFTLAQLGHPRIVDVYDYGVDAAGPYYTMELLDGGDLQRMAPVPWRDVCAYGRDVCSALALVHSRRSVYRDLSPRNVRLTGDGLAKLIDFGAMGPMGPAKELIGTLPCCAPECLDLQPLDARTDQTAFEKHAALAGSLGRRRGLSSARYALLVQRVGAVDVIGALTEQDSVLSQFTSMLASCKSSGERAERGLDMLVRLSGAAGGVLYALSSGGTARRSQVGRITPDEKMDLLARDYMHTEMNDGNETCVLDDASAVTAFTGEWKGPGEARYVPVLLSHPAKQGLAISGVAVLVVEGGSRFSYPAALATELSRLCHEAGDISVTIV